MLKVFRHKGIAVKILLWVIVLAVGGMMAATLVPGLGGASQHLHSEDGVLAQIGSRVVTQQETNRLVAQQLQRRFGGMDSSLLSEFRNGFLGPAVESLITSRAMVYEAERLGFDAPIAEVVSQLQGNPTFYPDGKFIGAALYESMISQQTGMTAAQFERAMQDDLKFRKLYLWVTGGIEPTPPEVWQEFRRRNDRMDLDYVVLRAGDFQAQVSPTEEDLRAYYDANRDSFQLPERRAARYVEISNALAGARITVSAEEIERLYNQRRAEYVEAEAVRARHILLTVFGEEQMETMRTTAEDIIGQLNSGGDFAELAKEHSTDPNSSASGGEWGWVERGQTVAEVEARLFGAEMESPAVLVQVSYGFEIVQPLEHRPERVRPLAEVRGPLEIELRQKAVENKAGDDAQQIALAVRNGQTLDEAAQAIGWQASEIPLTANNQRSLMFGQDGSFLEAVFRLPLTPDGQPTGAVSDPVPLLSGYVVVQLKEVSLAHPAAYDEVPLELLERYKQEKAAEMAREAAQSLADAASQSGFRSAARQAGLKMESAESINRDGSIPGVGLVGEISETIFALNQGEVSPALNLAGNWIVLHVTGRTHADEADLAVQSADWMDDLREQKRALAWGAFSAGVRARLEEEGVIQINQAAMTRLRRRR